MPYYNRKRGEDTEQEAVITWARYNEGKHPELKWLHHIPNGGSRNKAEAARLKAQGVKAGVSDLFLPSARAGCYGLYIEMKYGKNKPTEKQEEFIADMRAAGYAAYVAYGQEEAIAILKEYLAKPETSALPL